MTNDQNNDLTMIKEVKSYYGTVTNTAKVAANNTLQTLVTAFLNHLTTLLGFLGDQSQDTTGFTVDKTDSKQTLATTASALGDAASVYFELQNDHSTADKLHNAVSVLNKLSGNAFKTKCQEIYEIINNNIVVLDPGYVTAAEANTLQTQINGFDAEADEQNVAKQGTQLATKDVENSFDDLHKDLSLIDRTMAKYILSDKDFLTGYKIARKKHDYGLHHSALDGQTFNDTTNQLIDDVKVTDDQTGKFVVSGHNNLGQAGWFDMEVLKPKWRTFTATKPGFNDEHFGVLIKKGKKTQFNIRMRPL